MSGKPTPRLVSEGSCRSLVKVFGFRGSLIQTNCTALISPRLVSVTRVPPEEGSERTAMSPVVMRRPGGKARISSSEGSEK